MKAFKLWMQFYTIDEVEVPDDFNFSGQSVYWKNWHEPVLALQQYIRLEEAEIERQVDELFSGEFEF